MSVSTRMELRLTLEVSGHVFQGLRPGSREIEDLTIALVGPGGVTLEVPEEMFSPEEIREIEEALIEAWEDRL